MRGHHRTSPSFTTRYTHLRSRADTCAKSCTCLLRDLLCRARRLRRRFIGRLGTYTPKKKIEQHCSGLLLLLPHIVFFSHILEVKKRRALEYSPSHERNISPQGGTGNKLGNFRKLAISFRSKQKKKCRAGFRDEDVLTLSDLDPKGTDAFKTTASTEHGLHVIK